MKGWAARTAQAAETISSQIAAIQGETRRAVGAIQAIGRTVGEMRAIALGVATAMEEQGATASEIVRNVPQGGSRHPVGHHGQRRGSTGRRRDGRGVGPSARRRAWVGASRRRSRPWGRDLPRRRQSGLRSPRRSATSASGFSAGTDARAFTRNGGGRDDTFPFARRTGSCGTAELRRPNFSGLCGELYGRRPSEHAKISTVSAHKIEANLAITRFLNAHFKEFPRFMYLSLRSTKLRHKILNPAFTGGRGLA